MGNTLPMGSALPRMPARVAALLARSRTHHPGRRWLLRCYRHGFSARAALSAKSTLKGEYRAPPTRARRRCPIATCGATPPGRSGWRTVSDHGGRACGRRLSLPRVAEWRTHPPAASERRFKEVVASRNPPCHAPRSWQGARLPSALPDVAATARPRMPLPARAGRTALARSLYARGRPHGQDPRRAQRPGQGRPPCHRTGAP
jgi:hypothetical protein